MSDMDLKPLEQSRDLVLSKVQTITVRDSDSELQAADILKIVRTKLKEIEIERKSWTDPIEQHKKRIIAEFKRITAPLEEAEVKLSAALSLYRVKLEEARLKEQSKLQSREDKKFEKQIEQGKTPLIPEPLQIHVEVPSKSVGSVTYTEKWKADYDNVNIDEVPKFFNGVQILVVDKVAVNKLVTAGLGVPGIPIKKDIGTRVR